MAAKEEIIYAFKSKNQIKCFGLPVLLIGIKKDLEKNILYMEAHGFNSSHHYWHISKYFDGLDYNELEGVTIDEYIPISTDYIKGEAENILYEVLDEKGIPRELFEGFEPIELEEWSQFIKLLWMGQLYVEAIKNIATESRVYLLKNQFTMAMKLPPMKLIVRQ